MPGLLQRVGGAALAGVGQGIIAEAGQRRKETLARIREQYADKRTTALIDARASEGGLDRASREKIARLKAAGTSATARRANAAIEAARNQVLELDLDPQEFLKRGTKPSDLMQQLSDEGEYNPNLMGILRTAMKRKTGDDPDHAMWIRYGSGGRMPDKQRADMSGTTYSDRPVGDPMDETAPAASSPGAPPPRPRITEEPLPPPRALDKGRSFFDLPGGEQPSAPGRQPSPGPEAAPASADRVDGVPIRSMGASDLMRIIERHRRGEIRLTRAQIVALRDRYDEVERGR